MTPLELSILIHYRGCADDFRGGDFSEPEVRKSIDNFSVTDGLLERVPMGEWGMAVYRLSDRGNIFVDALCNLQPPVKKWVMPDN